MIAKIYNANKPQGNKKLVKKSRCLLKGGNVESEDIWMNINIQGVLVNGLQNKNQQSVS